MKEWNIEPFVALAPYLSGRRFEQVCRRAQDENIWFTPDNVRAAADAITDQMLDRRKLGDWLARYERPERFEPTRVGIIMAGNLPMVGFADLLAVLAAGHRATVKMSSKDSVLMGYVVECLALLGCDVETVRVLDRYDVDAVIATGSDSAREGFEQMFRGLPALLRGSRYSAAIITGRESAAQIAGLSHDMFRYWGLGCRSVSRLFVPSGYDIQGLAAQISRFESDYIYHEFQDCYRYCRAMAQISGEPFTDGGFFVLRPHREGIAVPMAAVDYTHYDDGEHLRGMVARDRDRIQCIVVADGVGFSGSGGIGFQRVVEFGQSQCPALGDYADGIDTMRFLLDL